MQCALGGTIAWLSAPVVANLVSKHQAMNQSFEPFKLVNTYGAFGSVSKTRDEIIIEGTHNPGEGAVWEEYEFVCKPGSVSRRPCLISPYHYRLDWLAWFAGFQNYQTQPWIVHLVERMLEGDVNLVSALLASNPFPDPKQPPKQVRVVSYRYRYTTYDEAGPLGPLFSGKDWWVRHLTREYLPPFEVGNPSVARFIAAHGWRDEKP